MHLVLRTAGEQLSLRCAPRWLHGLTLAALPGAVPPGPAEPPSSVSVEIESCRDPFDCTGWEPLTRDAWHRNGAVVVRNAGASGFDIRIEPGDGGLAVQARWRPPGAVLVLAKAMPARFHLLTREVLFHYPVLWWAGVRGRAPLHASLLATGSSTVLLAGPGGVGKSTLVQEEVARGASATSDNICVCDGAIAYGLVEPLRVEGGSGRRMPHGRREQPMPNRVPALAPDRIVVVRRAGEPAAATSVGAEEAARSLVAGTYMAGELRRYWALAATFALGTGLGPAAPEVTPVAHRLAATLPCLQVTVGGGIRRSLSALLRQGAVTE